MSIVIGIIIGFLATVVGIYFIKWRVSKNLNIGWLERIENKNRRFGSATGYYKVKCYYNGVEIRLLITSDQLEDIKKRAINNPEDFA